MFSYIIQKSIISQKGQALSEMILALPVCILIFIGLSLSFERAFWYFYGDHLLYESLICSSSYSKYECIAKAEKNINSLNFLNRKYKFEINSSNRNPNGHLKVYLPLELVISKKVKLVL